VASTLYRQVPNFITLGRLALTVVFFLLLNVHDADTFSRQMWIAFVIFLIAVLTDMLDGYLARAWKVESSFGRVVDPFVDKILICGAFIFFSSNDFINVAVLHEFPGFPAAGAGTGEIGSVTGVHPWMAVVLIAREFLITSIRGLAESKGIDFRADWAGKIKMIVQCIAVAAVIVDLAVVGHVPWVRMTRDIVVWITIVVTVLSATTYVLRARRLMAD
jgi:CDP-diacylglycerol--glycerol-3-phosphate 3-phosphatidyltransferase